ncbi:hypothetical protein VTN77DRAFT_2684 [Rasamsonia byssochlamydoides]|uniref:uncharacterized protein n=1 Tax=Rasamsonia byssochlamydoides TaxID=89139 RepID=UPI003742E026
MIDAQHICSPPTAVEYAIPLSPSQAACPARCGSPFDLSETACSRQATELSPAPAMRVPIDGVYPKLGEPPSAGESGFSDPVVSQAICPAAPKDALPRSPVALPEPKVSFEEFAIQYRRRQHAEAQRRSLEHRLFATKVSICLSARLWRVGTAVQKGLVEAFKHGDKPGFVTIYSTIHDIQEACDSAFRRSLHRQDPLEEPSLSLHSERTRSSGFMHQLSPKARRDLLEILNLVRTDPQFLFDRINSLMPSQLAALTSSVISMDTGDSVLSFTASRSRSQPLFSKRNNTHSIPFKDHALAFERTDPLSVLLFNVYAVPLDWDPAEARLRLDVWSSTCAKLISHGDSRHYPFVSHVLSYWSLCSDWKAKPKLELYLMDVLQKGAFLLENIESHVASNFGANLPDPLKTDAAEEFFDAAVQTLFEVLDDADAGLPSATLEFGNAVRTKIAAPGGQDRFLEYIFVQWFFSKFLYNTLSFPETQGLLLDFHIGKDAREKILGQIALRAQSQIFRVLHSVPQFSTAHPKVRKHVESMLAKFTLAASPSVPGADRDCSRQFDSFTDPSASRFLMLSAMDIITLLNALFPKPNFNSCDSALNPGSPPLTLNTQQFGSARSSRVPDPSHWPGRIETVFEQTPRPGRTNGVLSQSAIYSRNADLIRFELSDIGESEDRPSLVHPSAEDWTILTISEDGKSLSWNSSTGGLSGIDDDLSDDGLRSATIHPEDDYEALQTAIVKLVNESENVKHFTPGRPTRCLQIVSPSLKQRFEHARSVCERRSDFLGAHYWWTASQQLSQNVSKLARQPRGDSWILGPMLESCNRSLSQCDSVIRQCESGFVTLNTVIERLQEIVRGTMSVLTKLRNKMWYMTDVKNSMRYEDAKNVALALKTMVYPSLQRQPSNEYRFRNGTRYLASSFLPKPEMQVMNVMKAPSSQGGPNKLSDEQVELTRKWLTHHGIDNFCRGEERIHRFCYEVKSSVNKLVGDTMAETPVLWASELFQKERAKYEGPSNRGFPGISSVTSARPSSIASEDSLYTPSPFPGFTFRPSESFLRPQVEGPQLARKSSFQSLSSDKWKVGDSISSLGDSPGRAASSTTADSYSTFWSPPQTQAQSAASASSFQSRPPSMFSDAPAPRRAERERDVHGKTAFLDDLRQTLTSLLLSDLGCPVWSCGSETDAWFTNFLSQKRVQVQMDKRTKIQKFLAECDSGSHRRTGRPASRWHLRHRRSQSADPILYSPRKTDESRAQSEDDAVLSEKNPRQPAFAYETAFRQLMEVFSRHANPFVKLKALRDLRALVIASLNSSNEYPSTPGRKPTTQMLSAVDRPMRHSFSEPFLDDESLQTPTSPVPESEEFGSRPSYDLSPAESQVIKTMKDLIRKIQPKTLFRDLQFISAFVPSETLNKTDSGTAFLHFGLAALSLKEEVCNSMVEIADRIVSQELSRRHSPQAHETGGARSRNPIEDAAAMWIITAKEGNPVAQRELAILYLTHPEILPRVTLPLTLPRDTFKAEMMYRRDKDSKSDPQSMCLALHWMQLSANGGDELARNRLKEREEFESLA